MTAKTVDLSEIETCARRQGPKCWYGTIRLPKADREKLAAALEAPHITASTIGRWLDKKCAALSIQPIGVHAVRNHRNGECNCGK